MNLLTVRVGVILCLMSCGNHDKTDRHTDSTGYKNLILYREDTPIGRKEKVLFLRNVARTLHLPVLTGGFQGLYIRIWAWDPGE
ncbi:MAG TPA: hypothetical protein VHC48_24700, partial [Puia sp.]|nr:hypothetical protein [Puia sp.]